MLAYVFWHVPRAGVAARDYEAAHREFHGVLWRSRVAGLLALRVYRLDAIPWLPARPAGYEDWHLLEDSAALDRLNEAAVSQARQLPHDRIAALAADGTAGLYGLRQGALNEPTVAYWLSKPSGTSYPEFNASMKPFIDRGGCLWGRRMTLGPTPEFCLHALAGSVPPPAAMAIRMNTLLKLGPE
ncbi:MAG: hypothetical protein AB7T20_11250 [Steroidobacteraceae bacterium]